MESPHPVTVTLAPMGRSVRDEAIIFTILSLNFVFNLIIFSVHSTYYNF